MHNDLHVAKLVDGINILELGTADGTWVKKMARNYPKAKITALDRNPPYTLGRLPRNVKYIQQDIEGRDPSAAFDPKTPEFDYIYASRLSSDIKDWRSLDKKIWNNLVVGGQYEHADSLLGMIAVGPDNSTDTPAMRWMQDCREYFRKTDGIDALVMDKEGDYLKEVGFSIIWQHSTLEFFDAARHGGDALRASLVKGFFSKMVKALTPKIYRFDEGNSTQRAESVNKIVEVLKDVDSNAGRKGYAMKQ